MTHLEVLEMYRNKIIDSIYAKDTFNKRLINKRSEIKRLANLTYIAVEKELEGKDVIHKKIMVQEVLNTSPRYLELVNEYRLLKSKLVQVEANLEAAKCDFDITFLKFSVDV